MRLGTRKIIYLRKSKESKKKFFAFFIIMILFITLSVCFSYFLDVIRPAMISLAKTNAKRLTEQAINDAIITVFADDKVSYKDVIVLEKKEDGSITAAKSNLEGVNRLKAVLSNQIQKNINKNDTAVVSLPLGTITGTDILAGVGPRFNVQFVPYGNTSVNFNSKFEETGINQTRLIITLEVDTSVGLLIPTISTSVNVKTEVPVIQTIIVGDVPNSYTNVERSGEAYEDDVLQLAE